MIKKDRFCCYIQKGDIYYIQYTTPHEWAYAYYGPGQHMITCVICGLEILGDCVAGTPSYLGLSSHQATCGLCGGLFPAEACTKGYVRSYDETLGDTHEEICTVCNHVYTAQESCTFVYTDNEDGTHAAECLVCDVLYDISCDYQYTYTGNGLAQNTHTTECPVCDHSEEESCTLAFRYNGQVDGNNTHVNACTSCGHIVFEATACTYNSSGVCRFCGTHQAYVPINGAEEELLAE